MRSKIMATLLFSIILGTVCLFGEDYKVSIKQLPTTEANKTLITELATVTGNKVEISVAPPPRSVLAIESKLVDIELPNLGAKDPAKVQELKFDLSTTSYYSLAFVLYTNKDKALSLKDLLKTSKDLKIETDGSLINVLGITASASASAEASMKKVDSGAIDACVYSQTTGDAALKSAGVKNVKRQLFDNFEQFFAIQKGTKGGAIDKMITEGLAKLKASGRFEAIMGEIVKASKYSDWQP